MEEYQDDKHVAFRAQWRSSPIFSGPVEVIGPAAGGGGSRPSRVRLRADTRVVHIAGYNRFSFTRASAVVNCQSVLTWLLFQLCCHAATSSTRVCLSAMRRSRHWPDKTLSSDSAMFIQLPCFGVKCHSNRSTNRRASAAGKAS